MNEASFMLLQYDQKLLNRNMLRNRADYWKQGDQIGQMSETSQGE